MNLIPRMFYLDDFFDDFLISGTNNLKCDIYEKSKNYFIEADLPGFPKEAIKVETEDGYLTISASKEEKKDDETRNYIRHERTSKSYKRKFNWGSIEEESIKTELKDGTLKIVPKISAAKNIMIEQLY